MTILDRARGSIEEKPNMDKIGEEELSAIITIIKDDIEERIIECTEKGLIIEKNPKLRIPEEFEVNIIRKCHKFLMIKY
jgi:hypothetical protein